MDIELLLNPAGESHVLTEATDEDIYQAVVDAVKAREDIETNGGDDVDDDGPVKPPPGHSTVLQATSIIVEHLATWNHPIAREIEPLLSLMTRQLHIDEAKGMKDTLLTDYYRTLD